MKTFNKIILLVLSVVILLSFASCGVKENNENESKNNSSNEVVSTSSVTEKETEPTTYEEITEAISSFDKNTYSPKISKSTAKEKSKKALEQYIKNELDSGTGAINIDEFEFRSMELKMPSDPSSFYETDNYGNPVKKEFKNPYWYVEYKYTPELCDFAYFLIDAENGEILYSGYMGD